MTEQIPEHIDSYKLRHLKRRKFRYFSSASRIVCNPDDIYIQCNMCLPTCVHTINKFPICRSGEDNLNICFRCVIYLYRLGHRLEYNSPMRSYVSAHASMSAINYIMLYGVMSSDINECFRCKTRTGHGLTSCRGELCIECVSVLSDLLEL